MNDSKKVMKMDLGFIKTMNLESMNAMKMVLEYSRTHAWASKNGAWREFWVPRRDSALSAESGRLGAGYLALACLGVILGADSGRVQLFYCNFPSVVLGSNQLSTIDIYIPNRSLGRKLSNAIGIR
ncbi:hypothetical protein PIB30_023706 [Stylosanthes scabra]|uniref:Uncharacterized protein n=1 Tax=Stylosanthes scabra TaxID=79078 RepID=A0ABU6U8V1_9FABA|nr:hypothetical protein [Stylosanthes scabra]